MDMLEPAKEQRQKYAYYRGQKWKQGKKSCNESQGKQEGGKKVGLLFCSAAPGCGCIKSIFGANSCQGLNPISLR